MLKALIKSRLSALFAMFFKTKSTKRASSPVFKILIGIAVAYVAIVFIGLFTGIFLTMSVLSQMGLGWLYFALAGIIAFALSFVGSVFAAQQQIYASTDNELLLSMPIPSSYIIASRIITLVVLNLGLELFVVLPAGVVWCLCCPISPLGVVMYILCCLALPFLSITLSCILGWLITIVTNRVRNKSIVSVIISVLFLAVYFVFVFNADGYIEAAINNAGKVADTVRSALLPAWAFGAASAQGDVIGLLIFLACSLVPFAIVYAILSKSFIHLATDKRGFKKVQYREKALKTSGVFTAMLKKELRHFFTNGMYILNAAFGSIILIIGAVFLILYRDVPAQIFEELPFLKQFAGAAGAAILCFISSMNLVSAPSVSLEGKTLWIIRSMPVLSGKTLTAKAACHFVVTLPSVLPGAASLITVLPVSPADIAAIIIAPTVFTAFCALLGVVINLHFPKFDYINETAVVKQSPSVIITMLACMGSLIVPGGIYAFGGWLIIPPAVFMLLYSLVAAAVCALMYRYLNTWGAKRFEALE